MIEKLDVKKINRLLVLVSEKSEGIDIDVISHLLDSIINGDPDMRDNGISALVSLLQANNH